MDLKILALFAGFLLAASMVSGTTYYFSPGGNNGNAGTSNATAWQTMAKLSDITFGTDDVVCFNSGSYNIAAQEEMYFTNARGTITFRPCYEGQVVYITNYADAYASVPNSLWTNDSSGGINIWTTIYSGLSTNNPIIQLENGTEFINSECASLTNGTCDSSYPDWFTKYGNNFYRVWALDTSNRVKVILPGGQNPNNVKLYLSEEYATWRLRNNNGSARIIIQDLNFRYHRRAIDFSNSTNILVQRCSFDEGYNSILFRYGRTSTYNVTVKNNTFLGNHYSPFYNDWIKGAMEESDPVAIDPEQGTTDYYMKFIVENNTFQKTVGAVSIRTDHSGTMCNSRVSGNVVNCQDRGCYESTFEIEDYCCNSTWEYNRQYGGELAAVSFGGANASVGKCSFHHNLVVLNDTIVQNSTRTYETYAVKAYNPHGTGTNIVNWNITQNTFIAKGRGWYSGLDTSNPELFQVSVTNNIFVTDSDLSTMVRRTGTDANGNYWNNNIYFHQGSGGLVSYYMSDASSTSYATLALAKGSPNWDGQWDTASSEADPQLSNLFVPSFDSPACNMGTGGGYVGRYPCDYGKVDCRTYRGIFCGLLSCTYAGSECLQSIGNRPGRIVCTGGGCS